MKKSCSTLFLAPLTVLVLASVALAPVDDAFGRDGARAGGGGGGGAARAGGGARAGAGGGAADRSTVGRPTCGPTMCAAAA